MRRGETAQSYVRRWVLAVLVMALTVMCFGLAWWLGLYLVERDPQTPYVAVIRRVGLGLVGYALILASESVRRSIVNDALADVLNWFQATLVYLPAVMVTGFVAAAAPRRWMSPIDLGRLWWWLFSAFLIVVALGCLVAQPPPVRGVRGVGGATAGGWGTGLIQCLMALAVLAMVLVTVAFLWQHRVKRAHLVGEYRHIAGLLFVLAIAAVFVFPFHVFAAPALPGAVGAALALLAGAALFAARATVAVERRSRPDQGDVSVQRPLAAAITVAVLFCVDAGLAVWIQTRGLPIMVAIVAVVPLIMIVAARRSGSGQHAVTAPTPTTTTASLTNKKAP